MFENARLKLTFWYLLIIMSVSISFSAVIYRSVSVEFERRFQNIESKLELRGLGLYPPTAPLQYFVDDLREIKTRVFFILLYTNGVIFLVSGLLGYFLAGQTLEPIENALNEQKRFVADASHELKTPLTALKTSIEVSLRNKNMTLNEAKKTLTESLSDIENLSDLSNYLLSLARLQKQEKINKEIFDIKEIVTILDRKFMPLANSKKLNLKISKADIKVRTNKDILEKLLSIFLDNSIKYTDKGSVGMLFSKTRSGLVISISDTGYGISARDLPHIYERFYQGDASRTKKDNGGFGLGLSLAKQITDSLNGSVNVHSKPGQGTVFTVKLPILF
jgi:signal transduction histidine kinase